jgi:hypothetical protein
MEKPAETATPGPVAPTTAGVGKHSIYWGFIVWPVAILLLYVLSFGPVMRFGSLMLLTVTRNNKSCFYTSPRRDGFLARFYAPLGWAYNETPLHKPLGMYMHLWIPGAFDKNGEGPGRK